MTPTRVTVHCSASPNGKPYSIETIRADHIKNRGYQDIGYHFVIDVDGKTHVGRPITQQGAHVQGDNEGNVGICLIGTDQYTRKQWDSLMKLLADLLLTHGLKPWDLFVHNYFPSARAQGKACPGFEVGQLVSWYAAGLEQAIWKNILEVDRETKHQTLVSSEATMEATP